MRPARPVSASAASAVYFTSSPWGPAACTFILSSFPLSGPAGPSHQRRRRSRLLLRRSRLFPGLEPEQRPLLVLIQKIRPANPAPERIAFSRQRRHGVEIGLDRHTPQPARKRGGGLSHQRQHRLAIEGAVRLLIVRIEIGRAHV